MAPWFLGALALAGVLIGLALWAGPPKSAKRTASASSSARMAVQQPMKPVVLPPRPAAAKPAPAKVLAVKPITGGAGAKPLTELSPTAKKPDAIAAALQQKHELGRRRMQHQEELNSMQVAISDFEAAIARKENVAKNQADLEAMRERAAAVRRSLAVIRAAEQSLA